MSTKMSSLRANLISTPRGKSNHIENTPISSKNKSPKLIQLIEQKFAKQTEVITAKIDEAVQNSLRIFENKILEITANINGLSDRVNYIESSLPQIQDLKKEISDLKIKLNHQENINVSCNLKLCGIPNTVNEDLSAIFSLLCDSLKIATPNIASIHRIRNNRIKSVDGPIFVKCFSPIDRNFILRTVSTYKRETGRQLSLDMCGFHSNKHFFLNEDLTKDNYKIFQTALKMKKQKLISTAFTLRGLVYVKIKNEEKGTRVDSLNQLDQFFRVADEPNILRLENNIEQL